MAHLFPGPPIKEGVGGSAWNLETNGGDTDHEAGDEVGATESQESPGPESRDQRTSIPASVSMCDLGQAPCPFWASVVPWE